MKQGRGLGLMLKPRSTGEPVTQWLRDALRHAIVTGVIVPGGKLPSSRELSRAYGLARGTAVTALEELRAEGYLKGIRGSGLYVRSPLPDVLLEARAPSVKDRDTSAAKIHLSRFAKNVEPYSHYSTLATYAFRTNLPALDRFPTGLWARITSRSLRRSTVRELFSAGPGGHEDLRSAIAEYLVTTRGAHCDASQVVIVSGVREALDLATRLLIDPGDRVLVEDPGYHVAYASFRAAGARLISVPIDDEGAAPTSADIKHSKLMYLTPGHQFPTGATMSAARRLDILSNVSKSGAYIFEDDYDSEFRYVGRPLPVLQGLGRSDRVILAGSFNKTMFSALRLGYVVVPPALVEPLLRVKALSQTQAIADQLAFCEFLREGHFARHLRRMRKLYAERYEMLRDSVTRLLSDYVSLSPIQAGMQTVAWLKQGLNAEVVARSALRRNVDVIPLSRYVLKAKLPEGIQLGFAGVDELAIERGVRVLASVMKRQLKESPHDSIL
ncbi:MAG: PLP-dependent aminotransferase family protein [Acidobacteriaceae bacterium]